MIVTSLSFPNVVTGSVVVVSYPSVEEQIRITSMFDNLDRLISLHQHKLEVEQIKKKALMQLLLSGVVRVNV